MALPSIFRGFSTIDAERSHSWTLTDVNLIKRDLLNHFHTRVGERVMRPRFGCRIWDYLFQNYDPHIRDAIIAEAERVVDAEPRVSRLAVNILDFEQGIRIEITVSYLNTDIVEKMIVDFEGRDVLSGQIEGL